MIKLEHFSLRIKDNYLLKDANFAFNLNNVYLIYGKSGCGKTTFLRCLYGLLDCYKGRIIGEINQTNTFYANKDDCLFLNNTVKENLEIICNISNPENYYIKRYDLEKIFDNKIYQLSLGEKERLILTICFILNKSINLLDEVTSNLDKKTLKMINEDIELLKDNHLWIIVSHYREKIESKTKELNFIDLEKEKEEYKYEEVEKKKIQLKMNKIKIEERRSNSLLFIFNTFVCFAIMLLILFAFNKEEEYMNNFIESSSNKNNFIYSGLTKELDNYYPNLKIIVLNEYNNDTINDYEVIFPIKTINRINDRVKLFNINFKITNKYDNTDFSYHLGKNINSLFLDDNALIMNEKSLLIIYSSLYGFVYKNNIYCMNNNYYEMNSNEVLVLNSDSFSNQIFIFGNEYDVIKTTDNNKAYNIYINYYSLDDIYSGNELMDIIIINDDLFLSILESEEVLNAQRKRIEYQGFFNDELNKYSKLIYSEIKKGNTNVQFSLLYKYKETLDAFHKNKRLSYLIIVFVSLIYAAYSFYYVKSFIINRIKTENSIRIYNKSQVTSFRLKEISLNIILSYLSSIVVFIMMFIFVQSYYSLSLHILLTTTPLLIIPLLEYIIYKSFINKL